MFKGSFTALVTPFDANGKVDEKAFADFVEWQIAEGIKWPCAGWNNGRVADLDP